MTYLNSKDYEMEYNRITLTSKNDSPSREQICSRERLIGESHLNGFDIEWGGYILLEDNMRLSAQWLYSGDTNTLKAHIKKFNNNQFIFNYFENNDGDEIQVI